MNIFVTDSNPYKSAAYLDDKRVVKMVLESAQLLSTAISLTGGGFLAPYKVSHANHPCSLWTRTTRSNYEWLLEHFKALCEEYTKRYSKIHKCQSLLPVFSDNVSRIPTGELTAFPNCTIFKQETDIHKAYIEYLDYKWKNDKRKPTWYGKVDRNIDKYD